MIETAKSKLQARADAILSAARAMELLLNISSESRRNEFLRQRKAIAAAGKKELRELLPLLERQLRDKRNKLGMKLSTRELADFLPDLESAITCEDSRPMMSMVQIQALFPKLIDVLPEYAQFPKHTLFFIEEPVKRLKPNALNWFILECACYEDMCALFDAAFDQQKAADPRDSSRPVSKLARALRHATLNMAYYFVEAYLNGLAFSVLLDRSQSLTKKDKGLLTEIDPETGKRRALTLRDKLLQYPRIVLGVAHPSVSGKQLSRNGLSAAESEANS